MPMVYPELFDTVAEAQAKASFRILVPQHLPAGASLAKVQYYEFEHSGSNGYDFVSLFFEGPDGNLMIRQGNYGLPIVLDITPSNLHGETVIQGKDAIWVYGRPKIIRTDPPKVDGWETSDILQLGWEPTEDLDSGLPRSFAILGNFSLAELVAIGESVR